jgi:hypothetical protein
MAILTFAIPTMGLTSPSSWGSRDAIKNQINTIWSKYGNYFKFASVQSGLNVKILVAFCAVESGGNPIAGGSTSPTQGLMQFNKNYVKEQLKNEFKSGRLSDAEKQKLASYGFKFDSEGNTRDFTQADLVKPELNILVGSIILSQLADQPWARINGQLRLDRIIVVYNAGLYGKWGKIATQQPNTSPLDLHNKLEGNRVSQSYLSKMMGKNGALDIATSDLNSLIA